MARSREATVTIQAELRTPVSTTQVVHVSHSGLSETRLESADSYRIDMCITPRPIDSRACYVQHWNQHRFDPLGKIFLIPPDEQVIVRSDGDASHTSVICHINRQAVNAGLAEKLHWSEHQFEASLDIQHRYIQSLLVRLSGETSHQSFASELFVEHLTAQLAIELARYFVRADSTKGNSGGLSSWRLRLIEERLTEVRESPSVGELASLCKMSERQLSRAFRISRGCSLGEYIEKYCVDHAKRMLIADEDIKVIAYTLGFSSPASFGFAFRRATGSTPRAFKQRAPAIR